MRIFTLSLLTPLSIFFASCDTKETSSNSIPSLAEPEQLTYMIGSSGRSYEGDRISNGDFLEGVNADIDIKAKKTTRIQVELKFLGVLTWHRMISLKEEADVFILRKYEGPFEEPVILGKFPDLEVGVSSLKNEVKKVYDENEEMRTRIANESKEDLQSDD